MCNVFLENHQITDSKRSSFTRNNFSTGNRFAKARSSYKSTNQFQSVAIPSQQAQSDYPLIMIKNK